MTDALAHHGSPIRLNVMHRAYYAIGHPDHFKHVVVDRRDNYTRTKYFEAMQLGLGRSTLTTDGPWWRERRAIVRPALGRDSVESLAAFVTASVDEMLDRWDHFPDSQVLDLLPETHVLTLDIIARCMFGEKLRIETPRLARHFDTMQQYFRRFTFLPFSVRLYGKLPMPLARRFRKGAAELDREIERFVGERRNRPRHDLLSILIRSKDDAGRGLNDRELRDEVVTLLHSGHETSMVGLLWTLSLVARHPQVRERLECEIEQVLGERTPTAADLCNLPYAEMVFKEALRLYPPVPAFSRRNLDADRIGDVELPAGSYLHAIIWAVHQHPEFWNRPRVFDPERFSPQRMNGRHGFAYLPFGAGPHRCIGYHLAMLEGILGLAMITRRFRLEQVEGFEPRPRARISLRPWRGLPMRLRPRC